MKKITILLLLAAYSHVSIAQKDEIATTGFNDTIISKKIASLEERVSQQQAALESLKAENNNLKKEVLQLKSSAPKRSTTRKYSVSRRGSKQGVIE